MKETEKQFTTEEFKSEIIPLIEEGLTFPLTVTGSSMTPFIVGGRDTVYITKPHFPLKVGDIAFFERENGRIVMHRICKIKKDGYYFIGDAEGKAEGPIPQSRIFGEVKSLQRKGKSTDSSSFTFRFFKNVWVRIIPLRPLALSVYEKIFKKK